MVARQDITIYQGDDYAAAIAVTDDQGNPADLTGYSAQAQIRLYTADQSPDVLVEMTATVDAANSAVNLLAASGDTAQLKYDRYCWDVQLINGGVITTLLTGYVNIYQQVTVAPYVAGSPATTQTPWLSDIDTAGFNLSSFVGGSVYAPFQIDGGPLVLNLKSAQGVGVNTPTPAYAVDVVGDVNVTGHFFRSGVPVTFSNQSVVTGSRVAEGIYRNTSGKPMFVTCCWNLAGNAANLSFLSDANNPPTTLVAQISDSSPQASIQQLFCLVLDGNYYQCHITGGTPALVSWVEYS